ncbi:MAG: FAD-dependent monooxygenase [Flavobacteriaceae bacterium]|jgi:2-polyprenyl-6-methoxyphenol hydroxylase-like FAD-dependent oxidoreductase|nr:FAD-dependent monooxygenase [Flavobacteriaceae bacterium]
MKVAIIGGGIAGLTAAIALKKANIPFVVYEASQEIKPVGAGIAIANNAMQVYRYFGISNQLNQRGMRISTIALTDAKLNILTQSDLTPFEEKYQLANIAIHRSELHQVLLDQVGTEHILLDKRLDQIHRKESGLYQLCFTDQSTSMHEYVIGADGIRSNIRQQFFGNYPLRDAHQVCWRGVLNFKLPEKYHNVALEGWGRGKRFGFVQLEKQQVSWYFLINENDYSDTSEVRDHLFDCHPLVQEIIKQTAREAIFKDKIYDLSLLNEWHKDKICLIGDAAHATTPNFGQGACQAIEDVYIISKLLEQYSLADTLKRFSSIRRSKAHTIVKDSWKLGQMAQWSNPSYVAVRNSAFRILPAFAKNKQIQMMFELQKVF